MIHSRLVRAVVMVAMMLALAQPADAHRKKPWVGSWATSLLDMGKTNAAPAEDMRDATVRQVVRVSLGGKRIRLRLSNLFGTSPLAIGAATAAVSADGGSARIITATLRTVTFGGKPGTVIAAGQDVLSDPVALPVSSGADLAISLHVPDAPASQTGHPGSRTHSWFVHGNQTAATDLTGAKSITRWYFLANVDVEARGGRAIVVMGDSITDGYGVQPGTNQRWTDFLRVRMQRDPALSRVAVLNAGIGGNSIRYDGVGPKPLSRFKREVLDVPGVTHLIFLEGVNDLRSVRDRTTTPAEKAKLVQDMIAKLSPVVAQVRARGIKVIGVTILPYGRSMDNQPTPFDPTPWNAMNDWIRTPGNFDAVIDLARLMADPRDPTRLRSDYDNDGLHPSIAGYQAMADAVPLDLLKK